MPAPKEHLEYRLLNGVDKLKYVIRTIRFDFTRKNDKFFYFCSFTSLIEVLKAEKEAVK